MSIVVESGWERGVAIWVWPLYRDFPIVVVATSSKPNAITAQVAMEMLHVVKVDPPSEAERLSMLRGVAGDYLTAPDIHWPQVARHTAVSGPNSAMMGTNCPTTLPRVLFWET